jgi:hypothetical protein
VRVSNDVGKYFCEFQLYALLAVLHRREEFGMVMSLHTPLPKEHEDIQRGVEVTTALIQALLEDKDFKEALYISGSGPS